MIYEGLFVSLQRPTKNNDPMKELYFADQNRYDNGMEYERCGRSVVWRRKSSFKRVSLLYS